LVAVLMTARRGCSVSDVNTIESSTDSEIRCVWLAIGITAIVLCAARSSTDTVPGPTLAV
jgi:hypothetical protein